jgi:23S rRNA (adenine2503-C2)-methyltransferase
VHKLNLCFPDAQLLVSTIGVKNPKVFESICHSSKAIDKVGLQFSLHSGYDDERDEIIPFKNKMSIREIRDAGIMWNSYTHRPVYLNICVDEYNLGPGERNRIMDLFSPSVFNLTFSVICEYVNGTIESKKTKDRNEGKMQAVMSHFLKEGYNIRKFDPAGKDDIGAGCGQLWYVQKWMKEKCK